MLSLQNRKDILFLSILAAILLIVLPMGLDAFRLNLIGKYLTYAFVTIGLVACWGDSGILSLGQGIFFGLGGYCMAMFLKLQLLRWRLRRTSLHRVFQTLWIGTRLRRCRGSGSHFIVYLFRLLQ